MDTEDSDNFPRPVLDGSLSLRPMVKITVEDLPPEGSPRLHSASRSDRPPTVIEGDAAAADKKLSAKEELQLKVKQIAKEMAEEPVPHVRSLDSFFRNFKFNGYNVTAGPSAIVSKLENIKVILDHLLLLLLLP